MATVIILTIFNAAIGGYLIWDSLRDEPDPIKEVRSDTITLASDTEGMT